MHWGVGLVVFTVILGFGILSTNYVSAEEGFFLGALNLTGEACVTALIDSLVSSRVITVNLSPSIFLIRFFTPTTLNL